MVCTNLICEGLQENLCNAVLWPCKAEGHVFKAACFIISVGHICSFKVRQLRGRGGSGGLWWRRPGEGPRNGEGGKKGTHFFLSTVTRKVTVGVSSHLLSSALLIGRWKWKWWIITDNDFSFLFFFNPSAASACRSGSISVTTTSDSGGKFVENGFEFLFPIVERMRNVHLWVLTFKRKDTQEWNNITCLALNCNAAARYRSILVLALAAREHIKI